MLLQAPVLSQTPVQTTGDIYMTMHLIVFVFAAATPLALFATYFQLGEGSRLRKIILMLVVSFTFGGIRWSGGSIAAMQVSFIVENPIFVPLWTFSGILAAGFGLYAAKLLLDFSKEFGFKSSKRSRIPLSFPPGKKGG